jgi:hypothetical protein
MIIGSHIFRSKIRIRKEIQQVMTLQSIVRIMKNAKISANRPSKSHIIKSTPPQLTNWSQNPQGKAFTPWSISTNPSTIFPVICGTRNSWPGTIRKMMLLKNKRYLSTNTCNLFNKSSVNTANLRDQNRNKSKT